MSKPFAFTGRVRSFRYAFRGLLIMLATQHNAWIHLVATCAVFGAGAYVGLGREEWCWIILAVVAVWMAEAMNTAFELLLDATNPAYDPLVGKAKDVAAASVLIAACGAVAIGVVVFAPHLFRV